MKERADFQREDNIENMDVWFPSAHIESVEP
jgi:hypothetical protein